MTFSFKTANHWNLRSRLDIIFQQVFFQTVAIQNVPQLNESTLTNKYP